MKTVLTIAGSDCSGGAGIQADLKTIAAHKLYGMSAITSLTAQNTTGVYGIYDVSPEFLKNQLDCIFTDIFPDAVKIGMVSNSGLIQVIADTLKQYRPGRVVLDPVMVSTSGSRLIAPEAQETLVTQLMRNTANDCLYTKEGTFWFEGKRVENDNTHGTGCTLSSAIACNLAMGHTMQESVENAKRYITGALQAGLNLGKGSGPLEHTYWLEIQGEK